MKKIVCALVLVCLVGTTALFAVTFGVGISGGGNFSSYFPSEQAKKGLDAVSQKPAFNFSGGLGAVVVIGITPSFVIQPEVNYYFGNIIGGGYKTKDLYTKVTIGELDIPILFKFRTKTGLSIFAGPVFSFLLGDITTRVKVPNLAETNTKTKLTDVPDQRTFHIGFQAGVDYSIRLGPGDLQIGARYGMDLTDLHNGEKAGFRWYVRPTIGYVFFF